MSCRQPRPRPDPRSFHRLQETALPLGLRRHADHEGACRQDAERLDQAHLPQKYHFVSGWLPWFADALNLIFTWAGLAWVLAVMVPPLFGIKPVGLPPAEFIAPTIGIFVFKLIYSFGLYANRVNCTFRQSIGASLAGLALTYTVGRAVIYGLCDQPAALHAHAQDGRARDARHGARHRPWRGAAHDPAVARGYRPVDE